MIFWLLARKDWPIWWGPNTVAAPPGFNVVWAKDSFQLVGAF